MLPDRGELPLHVDGGLGMEGEAVGAGVGVLVDVALRPLHHQVHVERAVGDPAEGPDHRRAEGEVRDEVPVHHVHVDPVRAAGERGVHLLAQPAEVGAQDAGCDDRIHGVLVRVRSTRLRRGSRTPGDGRCSTTTPGRAPGWSAVRT